MNELIYTNKIWRILFVVAFALFAFAPFSFIRAQTDKVEPKIGVERSRIKTKKVTNPNDVPFEKSIIVDSKVNVSLCVSDGKLKINGWERSEIRAFVSGGSEVGFNVREKSKQSDKPIWIKVLGYDPLTEKQADECLSGEEIELDVPRGATVNVVGQASETTIESIAKASVENIGGDIFLNNIERGVYAKTYEGDVTVGNSGGAVMLLSTTGNIVAFDIAPSEIADAFKAKTSSGAISLKNVEHRQMEVGSNSGSMRFEGAFQTGGQYNFGTTNGSISLTIPEKTSCKIVASYGGAFNSELPLSNVLKNSASKTQNFSATIGNGDATLTLTTFSGAIRIKKQ